MNCGNQFDYFAYGGTEKESDQGYFELDHPILSSLMYRLSIFINYSKTLYNRKSV